MYYGCANSDYLHMTLNGICVLGFNMFVKNDNAEIGKIKSYDCQL